MAQKKHFNYLVQSIAYNTVRFFFLSQQTLEHINAATTRVHYYNSYPLMEKVDGQPRGMGRLKRMWMEIIKVDVKNCNLFEDLAQDRS